MLCFRPIFEFCVFCSLFFFSLATFERSSHQRCPIKSVLKNFAKLTRKYLCHSRPETLLTKRLGHKYFLQFLGNFLENLFIENFQVPALSFLLETPIFLSPNLPNVRLLVFYFTLHMFLPYLWTDNIPANSSDSYIFVLYVCWLNKLLPGFHFRINVLDVRRRKNMKTPVHVYPWFKESH